jgi:hypothetical protein
MLDGWIKIHDKTPPQNEDFLAYVLIGFHIDGLTIDKRKSGIQTCLWNGYKYMESCHCSGYEHDMEYIEVTHWIPLPLPPQA